MLNLITYIRTNMIITGLRGLLWWLDDQKSPFLTSYERPLVTCQNICCETSSIYGMQGFPITCKFSCSILK